MSRGRLPEWHLIRLFKEFKMQMSIVIWIMLEQFSFHFYIAEQGEVEWNIRSFYPLLFLISFGLKKLFTIPVNLKGILRFYFLHIFFLFVRNGISYIIKMLYYSIILFFIVILCRPGGLGVTSSPRDLRFAGSNPAEVDGFFSGQKIPSTSPREGL